MMTAFVKIKSGILKCVQEKTAALALVLLLCPTPEALAHRDSYLQTSYAFTLNMAQSIEELESSYTLGYDVRWISFRSRIFALTGEYNSAKSALYERTAYQQTRVGVQYYPLSLGVDFQDSYESVLMTYSSFVKPYVGANVGFGRFLIATPDLKTGNEQSVDHVIIGGAIGATLQFTSTLAADFAADTGYVLSNSALALSGLLVRARAGLMVAF
jgi:hypothetical protein